MRHIIDDEKRKAITDHIGNDRGARARFCKKNGIKTAALSQILTGKRNVLYDDLWYRIVANVPALQNMDNVFEPFGDMGKKETEKYKRMAFGADIYPEFNNISLALYERSKLNTNSPDYEKEMDEYNAEILNSLMAAFQKIAETLKVDGLPPDYRKLMDHTLHDFRSEVIGILIDSDMDPVSKDKALKLIRNFDFMKK